MAGSLSPYIRTPLTDITGGLISHQLFGKCPREEMRYMECLEAYGVERGRLQCKKELDNFFECQSMNKQMKRVLAIQKERARQIREGKLVGDERYVNPKLDSY